MKKIQMPLSVVCALAVGLTAALAVCVGVLNLPMDPVSASHGEWNHGGNSTIDVTLSGVGDGFDVSNGTHPGWCIEDNHRPNPPDGTLVTLFDSTCDLSELPSSYQSVPWDKVNYLLNHKQGTVEDFQAALWMLTWGASSTFPVTPLAQAMLDDAHANGDGFVPGAGQVVAAILFGDGLGPDGFQDTLIEVPAPVHGEGCTPGYWKNHLGSWPATGLSPDDDFDTTFGVDYFHPDITLGRAIRLGGGGVKKAARHGTAGLLSALHPDVAYPLTAADVIAYVQAMDIEPIVEANELGCNLGNAPDAPSNAVDTSENHSGRMELW